MTREQLYKALVRLCQDYGFAGETTYAALHTAIDSLHPGGEGPAIARGYVVNVAATVTGHELPTSEAEARDLAENIASAFDNLRDSGHFEDVTYEVKVNGGDDEVHVSSGQ